MPNQRYRNQSEITAEAQRIFSQGGKLRAKHLPALTGMSRTRLEVLFSEGNGPAYFQAGPGCVRLFDSNDVRKWMLSKRKGNG